MTDWNGDETDHWPDVESGGSSTDPLIYKRGWPLWFDLLYWFR